MELIGGTSLPDRETCLKTIEETCRTKALWLWGRGEPKTVPKPVGERLKRELSLIRQKGCERDLYLAAALCRQAREWGYPTGSRGGVCASFAAFLLEITTVNPLPPHYYCSSCGTMEQWAENGVGWDLPPKVCPVCGTERYMARNGFGLDAEEFFGERNQCSIALNMAEECRRRLAEALLGDLWEEKHSVVRYGRCQMLVHRDLDLLRQIRKRTMLQSEAWGDMSLLEDSGSLLGITLFDMEPIRSKRKERKTEGLDDLVRLVQDAYSTSTFRFMRAHAVSYCEMSLRLAYHRFYHPRAFYESYFEVFAEEEKDRSERYSALKKEQKRAGDGQDAVRKREGFQRYYNEKGELGVLYSPGFGAGFSGAGDDGDYSLALDSRIIGKFLEGVTETEFCDYVEGLGYHRPYLHAGAFAKHELVLEFIPPGTWFCIHEYDGYETIETPESLHMIRA